MIPKEQQTLLIIYGRGGHKEQMKRLLESLKQHKEFDFVSIADVNDELGSLEHLRCPEPRDKFHFWKAPFQLTYTAFVTLIQTLRLLRRHNIVGLVSTGPGMAVIPSILFRLCRKKVVYLESWSRFYSASATGIFMYKIANRFYVQNETMLAKYPKATYSGRL
ncbi:hypothetical protein MHM95_09360 [Pseudoalteromonas sp. CnMc7-15]|uniref:PssD/Cps14F family polysaccharide biosynthesis glycosyltransferase n=1 Tax=unclassified Pseudoalteromonas TaxID=194690 RepID=UPI001EF67FF8|nr:PssD/Cps14F family polysaccharide biosynthesis glycosyltransferase [Pseudoalteromonas sp. CnMc7-15]MCG7566497.1 hypothetical protein [Pseudoalteromonas sp. CnMc7-15]